MQPDGENSQKATEVDERILVREILTGSQSAFVQLVRRYEKLVGHIVFRMVPRSIDREELCQEIFIKVYEKLATFHFRSKLSTWIGRIAYNACVNHLKKKRMPFVGDLGRAGHEDGDEYAAPRIAEGNFVSVERPDRHAELVEAREHLQDAMNQLDPRVRTILALFHQDGLHIEEIAEIMQMPEGTVKSHLYRARRHLKNRLLLLYDKEDIIS